MVPWVLLLRKPVSAQSGLERGIPRQMVSLSLFTLPKSIPSASAFLDQGPPPNASALPNTAVSWDQAFHT